MTGKTKHIIFSKLLISASFLQCFSVLAQTTLNTQLSPIVTKKEEVKEDEEKEPPTPGLSFGVPSAYGASGKSVFVGVSYGASSRDGLFTFYNSRNEKVADGSMNFGAGIGDPNQLAAEVSVGIISLACQESHANSCWGADGTAGLKIHKKVDSPLISGWGFGWSDIIRWGEASDFATIYGVASKDIKIKDKEALVSLGIGSGGFRTKADIDSNQNNPNLFGGVGVKLAPRLSLASSWNGSTLGSGFGISPFNFPVSVSAGVTDITNVNGKGMQYSINVGYSLSF